MKTRWIWPFALCLLSAPAVAPGEERPWELSLGLSYLATSGNSDSRTGGLDVSYKQTLDSWGIEATAGYLRAEADGAATADRTFVGVRGTRAYGERWKMFAGASVLLDEFSGLDRRLVAEGGMTYKAISSERNTLSFDVGAAWNSDDLATGGTTDYMSGIVGLAWTHTLSETARLRERVVVVPSFEASDDWRLSSETSLEAAVSAKLAVKLAYVFLFDNVPVAGFDKTDTRTSASLVITL